MAAVYDEVRRRQIFERTSGKCHMCRKTLAFRNYGRPGQRGAWEIDHSHPRARGGSDHGNNLYAACIPCNREKRVLTTRAMRARYGHTRAPLSASRRQRARMAWTVGLGVVGCLIGGPWGIVGRVIGGGVGVLAGSWVDPDA